MGTKKQNNDLGELTPSFIPSFIPSFQRDTLISADENREMFDRIATHYDQVNRLLSFGRDKIWRQEAVEELQPLPEGRYLDVGTGTGALVSEILKQAPGAHIDGIDPSEKMLQIAQSKNLPDTVHFFSADATALPMEDETYDGIILGFSFRNIEQREKAIAEIFRVLKPWGRLVILEAVYPANPIVRLGYKLYAAIVLLIGKIWGEGSAYRYLMQSIKHFPKPSTLFVTLHYAGFLLIKTELKMLGTIVIFSAPRSEESLTPPEN